MRIVIITSSTNRSGGTRQAIYQARGLADRGHDVTLCLPAQSSFWDLPEAERDHLWHRLPENPAHWRRAVEALLPASGPAIVHAFHNKAVKRVAWWGLFWRKRGIACVAHRGVIFRPGNPLPYLSPAMRAFIVNSVACARALSLHCPPRKLRLVQNGVPDSRVTPAISPEAMRSALNLSPDTFLFGYVGNNTPVKGAERLLKAFAAATQKGLDAALLLVGPDPDKWRPFCETLGIAERVRLAGKIENVADHLQICHTFVFPSVGMDSAPNTLLEALRMGLPVIAANVGGVPEMAEGCGIILPPEDSKALCNALLRLAANPEERLAFAAKSLESGKRFTVSARCEALERIYDEVLGN